MDIKKGLMFNRIVCIILVLLTGLVVCVSVGASSEYSDATTQAYEAELERLNKEKQQIENQLAEIRNNQTSTAEYGEYLSKQLSNLEDKIDVTQALITTLTKNISVKETEIENEKNNIERTYRNFLERIRISYEEQNDSFLEVLMDSEGLSDLLTRVERLNSLLDYDKKLKENYEQLKLKLENDKAILDADYQKQTKYEEELKNDIASYEGQILENDQLLEDLKDNEASAYLEYMRREEEREKLDKELEEYIQEMIAKSQEEYDGGKLAWPLPRDHATVTCDYGYDVLYIYGVEQIRHHNGIDLRCVTGTEVRSSASGVVQIATYSASYGYYVLIDHGSGVSTLYAHNSQLLVQPGQKVERGQLIAYSGNTGMSTGPHLHYEVRINGVRINPLEGNYVDIPSSLYILPGA